MFFSSIFTRETPRCQVVMSEVEVEVVVVRHGETDSNRSHTIQGHLDTPLSSLGRRQAECVATYLADTQFSQAISSDLARALSTGQAIARANTSLVESEIEQWEVLRERCFGELEGGQAGLMQEAVKGLNREEILAWGPRGGETGLQFRQRVRKLSTPINPSILSECLTVISPQYNLARLEWRV